MGTRLISKTWRVEGVLTNATSAKLSDSTGAYGVKENVSGTVTVADGTAMTNSATGVYEYSFTDTVNIAYTGYVEIVYSGATYYFEVDIPARSSVGGMVASYDSLLERVGHFLFGFRSGYSSDQTSDIENAITDGLRDVYAAHLWSFFRPVKTITTTDGTATYSLPTGYESIESEMHYAPGEGDFYPPLQQRSDSRIREYQQGNDETGRPYYFSIRTVDFESTVGSLRQLVLYPTPDDAYVLHAKMKLRPVAIDSTNPYPVGGESLSQLILEACLASAERLYDDRPGIHTSHFQELLPLAIAADRLITSPMSLGADAPRGENSGYASRAVRIGSVTIDGVTI